MNSASAHGGLVYVFLFVSSVSVAGIGAMIENSPKLTTFQGLLEICDENGHRLSPYKFLQFDKTLKQKYHCHKLFYTGGYLLFRQNYSRSSSCFVFLEQSDVDYLWDTD